MDVQEAGRLGMKVRWAPKYAMLEEMSKYCESKEELNRAMKLKSKDLAMILRIIEVIKNGKTSM